MAQIETTSPIPPVAESIRVRRGAQTAAGFDVRLWAPRMLFVGLLAAALVLVNTLPAVKLSDGSTLKLSEVATSLIKAGAGWVMTLTWLAGLIAAIAAVVFPRSER